MRHNQAGIRSRGSRGRRIARTLLILCTLLATLLSSCGGTPRPAPATPRPPTSPTAAAPTPAPAFPLRGPHIGYGMNAWLPADINPTLDLLTGAGFGWARQWVAWEGTEPQPGHYNWGEIDRIVAAAEARRVRLLLVFVRSPAWADPDHGLPRDPRLFADFMGRVAERYRGRVAAYEVWNEPNLAGEVGGRVDVEAYVAVLKAAFPAIKAADPRAIVVYGSLNATGLNDPAVAVDDVEFLRRSYAYNNGEIRRYFDVLGAHTGSMNNPPEALWPDNPGPGPDFRDHRSFYFRRVEDQRRVMEEAGDGVKQVWLTEFGWTTRNLARGYEYGEYNTEQHQAEYLVRAFHWARDHYPWMGVMFVWNLNFATVSAPDDEKTPWSIVNRDYSPRPAYEALKRMPK